MVSMVGRPKRVAPKYANCTTPDAIILAAEELCGKKGPSGLKIREIARHVGIEPASIYNHFAGLDGVLSALIRQSLLNEEELLEIPSELRGPPAIREFCLRVVSYFAERPGIVRLSLNDLSEVHVSAPNAFDENEEIIVRTIDREAKFLSKNLKLEQLDRKTLGEIAISSRSMVLALLSLTWLNQREVDAARITEITDLATAFLLGLEKQFD